MKLFEEVSKAKYISRPNRFTLICSLNGEEVKAYLPNPGRLQELLLPKSTLYLEENRSGGKLPYTAVAVLKEGYPVFLHTHRTNDIVEQLLVSGFIPGLETVKIVKREASFGGSRFDFLLKSGARNIVLEAKSCTLFSKNVAMFPDAVTVRGRKHVEELIRISNEKTHGMVLFVVYSPDAKIFLPEFHTDLDFSRTLLRAKEQIEIIPVSIKLKRDLSTLEDVKKLDIPWNIVKKESNDRGTYLILLRLHEDTTISVGLYLCGKGSEESVQKD
jgi:sugar fermentation stimulation protein A